MAGIPFPEKTKQGITKFLENVSRGDHGGLASYRPQEALSRSMTAEALVCRQFLGQPLKNSLIDEAASYILQELPDEGIMPNDYYWYYATLALYQVQDERWLKWNAAMTKTVLARQEKEGNHAGSWKTDSLWGGHGGRAYTTAISALTLEVYYRYLPIYTPPPPTTLSGVKSRLKRTIISSFFPSGLTIRLRWIKYASLRADRFRKLILQGVWPL